MKSNTDLVDLALHSQVSPQKLSITNECDPWVGVGDRGGVEREIGGGLGREAKIKWRVNESIVPGSWIYLIIVQGKNSYLIKVQPNFCSKNTLQFILGCWTWMLICPKLISLISEQTTRQNPCLRKLII